MAFERAAAKAFEEIWRVMGNRAKALLALASAAAFLLYWLAARSFHIPEHPGYEMSLSLQPAAAADFLLVGVTMLVATAVATVVAGSVRFDAGLFGAAVGLTALSCRGGPMRFVAQAAGGRGVFLAMALELLVLGALLGLAWFGLWLLYRGGRLSGDALRDGLRDQPHEPGERIHALLVQAAVMSVIVLLLARTDDKKQVLAAVGVASFAATLMSYAFSPVRPSVWYWAGPILVGVLGYFVAYLSAGSMNSVASKSGAGGGALAALARPLPLDYASLGTAGAILGYWTSRQWQRAKELEKEAAPA
jgi:hypothetical protein